MPNTFLFVAWIVLEFMKVTRMQKKITVTDCDYHRLMGLIEFASMAAHTPDVVKRLYGKLVAADLLPQQEIPDDVVTMNSRVQIRDLSTRRETEIVIAYPNDAGLNRISVFSEAGACLLGHQERDVISWKVPQGIGLFEVVKVDREVDADRCQSADSRI